MSRHRFGFVLSTGSGNQTRYLNLRKYVERDPTVEAIWAPNPGRLGGALDRLPDGVHRRVVALTSGAPVLRALGRLDAVMFHGLDAYVLAALRSLVASRPALVWSQDDAPTPDPRFWWHYGVTHRSPLRARARFAVDRFCARRVALFLPFAPSIGEELIAGCGVARERVHAINVGVDLELWPRLPATPRARKILFVGGSFLRKGGDLLLEVFARRLPRDAELHLVSNEAPARLPERVVVHADLVPNDPRLRALYAEAALLALPTRADLVPQSILEAMASGMPVVATRVGAIPDLVRDGESGWLVDVDDGEALGARIAALLEDPAAAARMGAAGRARVERDFDAARNVARILTLMKQAAEEPPRRRWPR